MATTKTTQAFDLSSFIEQKNIQAEETSRKPIKAIIRSTATTAVKLAESSVLLLDTINEELSHNLIETKLENLVELHKLAGKYNISVEQALELRSSLLK